MHHPFLFTDDLTASPQVKRWKNRTPVQHEANKAAQRRYRERKKGQVAELQAQADTLAAKARAQPQLPCCVPCPLSHTWIPCTRL